AAPTPHPSTKQRRQPAPYPGWCEHVENNCVGHRQSLSHPKQRDGSPSRPTQRNISVSHQQIASAKRNPALYSRRRESRSGAHGGAFLIFSRRLQLLGCPQTPHSERLAHSHNR